MHPAQHLDFSGKYVYFHMEVLTLLLVIFAALSYIDNHKEK